MALMEGWVLVTGNTYPVRAELKALGGVWDAAARGWKVRKEQEEAARALVGRRADPPGAQLWQPCRRRGCGNEPSYLCCECCIEHCRCG